MLPNSLLLPNYFLKLHHSVAKMITTKKIRSSYFPVHPLVSVQGDVILAGCTLIGRTPYGFANRQRFSGGEESPSLMLGDSSAAGSLASGTPSARVTCLNAYSLYNTLRYTW
jgi:hypothetical protein